MTPPQTSRLRRHAPLALALAAVVLPIVVATARAVARDWLPVGDNAIFAIRAWDVLTRHHPLLGTWTSASQTIGEHVNNPGPLYFEVLAGPTRLFGRAGVGIGAAIGNAIAAVGVVAVGWRRGGARIGLAVAAMTCGLLWTMGSELLFDPWQPHSLLLPFLLYLVLIWSLTLGDLLLLPVAAGVASLLVQTHLSYAVPVAALAVAAVAWAATHAVRRWRAGDRRHLQRIALATFIVAALCWVQPAIDQLAGDGNLGQLATSAGGGDEAVGPGLAAQIVAEVVATPPWWMRPSVSDALRPEDPQARAPRPGGLPSRPVAVAGLVVVAAVLAAAAARARRVRRSDAALAVGIAAVGLAVALAGTALLPIGSLGIPPHQVRYLWPLSLFAWFAVVVAVLPERWLGVGGGVVAAVLAIAALPSWNARIGPSADVYAIPVLHELLPQLDDVEPRGALLFDTGSLRFAEPYSTAVVHELQRRGVEVVVDDEGWAAQLGRSRRHDPGDAELRVSIRQGSAAVATASERRVGYVAGLDEGERRELAALQEELAAELEPHDLHLTALGRRARDQGRIRALDGDADVAGLVSSGLLAGLIDVGYVEVPADVRAAAARYQALVERREQQTVGVFLAPVEAP